MKYYTKKIYLTIPSELFEQIKKHDDISQIDNIVAGLLEKLYNGED